MSEPELFHYSSEAKLAQLDKHTSDERQFYARLDELRKKRTEERRRVNILSSPIITARIFASVASVYIQDSAHWLLQHRKILISVFVVILVLVSVSLVPGAHQEAVDVVQGFLLTSIWWIGLGVLSSIGLGTGLHTFVLYLGPHIARVTLVAYECGTISFPEYGPLAFTCPEDVVAGGVSLWSVFAKVEREAFLWGVGTALGELPPYFVARAARLSGQHLETEDEEDPNPTFSARVKKFLMDRVLNKLVRRFFHSSRVIASEKRIGFWGILLFASVPNPLFDLAGITCGHLLIPFGQFFTATFIGKALIKAHLQAIIVVAVFGKEQLTGLINMIERLLPFLKGKLHTMLDKERSKLHRKFHGKVEPAAGRSVFGLVWNCILAVMIGYFLLSLVNSSVQHHLQGLDDQEEARYLLTVGKRPVSPALKKRD